MSIHLTNCHMHVFVSECAPPKFLRVNESMLVKFFARPIKWLLESPSARKIIWRLNKRIRFSGRSRRNKLNRIISFLNIGAQKCQKDVFEYSLNIAQNYDSSPQLIAHTLDMDYMDTNSKPIIPFSTQLYEVLELKKYYPDNIFPFVGADPRAKSGEQLVDWIKYYFENGVKSKIKGNLIPFCSGIKLYPAHGFFPFDPNLDDLYKYAEENEIPLMFHCTRVGSQYIGNDIESLIPLEPNMLMPDENNPAFPKALEAQKEVYSRIDRYYQEDDWIKNSNIGENDFACDLFSHPQNYAPIMCKYPKLKICLAHMGGSEEVENMNLSDSDLQKAKVDKNLKKIWKTDPYNWALLIKNMMKEYENFYTDISSTITHLDNEQLVRNISDWLNYPINGAENKLGDRILFGTDFFMTEMSKGETKLYGFMRNKLGNWFDKMAKENVEKYLY